jgi:hypothetical protein
MYIVQTVWDFFWKPGLKQCCGSLTFWCVSDPDLDPQIRTAELRIWIPIVNGFQDVNKI